MAVTAIRRSGQARLLAGLLLLGLLQGCATAPQTQRVLDNRGGLPAHVELDKVPFFPQKRYQCGPASLAMVLTQAGHPTKPDTLKSEVYVPKREGSLRTEMRAAVRARGLVPYPLPGNMHALLAELAAGQPVLVMQNLGLSWIPRWHYAVAVGYDLDDENVVLRSGTMRRRITGMSTFERTWARSGHWAQVIVPPDRPPALAEPLPWLRTVHELESTGDKKAARTGYRAATRRWPQSRPAWMARGNAAYAAGDTDEARTAFEHAVRIDPHDADGWNNLAYALANTGRGTDALTAARCAVALAPKDGGPRATLRELENRALPQGMTKEKSELPTCPARSQ